MKTTGTARHDAVRQLGSVGSPAVVNSRLLRLSATVEGCIWKSVLKNIPAKASYPVGSLS